jgi:hypothetical protein
MQKAVSREKEMDFCDQADDELATRPGSGFFCLLPPAFCLLLSLCLCVSVADFPYDKA